MNARKQKKKMKHEPESEKILNQILEARRGKLLSNADRFVHIYLNWLISIQRKK